MPTSICDFGRFCGEPFPGRYPFLIAVSLQGVYSVDNEKLQAHTADPGVNSAMAAITNQEGLPMTAWIILGVGITVLVAFGTSALAMLGNLSGLEIEGLERP